jgi:hydrogenase maturation protein HypF
MPAPRTADAIRRTARRIVVSGRVQGVGFRPFTYRLAQRFALTGWVRNDTGRVVLHVEGPEADLERFEVALIREAPSLAEPSLRQSEPVECMGSAEFRILASEAAETPEIHLPPDLHCCPDCRAELLDPTQRRFRYPFTNCTQCGPRYTLIEALPYDRASTSMRGFALCPSCRAEYENPADRRFHAEPLACPQCGPSLSFECDGVALAGNEAALRAAIACLRSGAILAVKGVGGYHLMCDPASDAAVARLRERKCRPDKPLAVMFPENGPDGLQAVRAGVILSDVEAQACTSAARPIVLATRIPGDRLSAALAPGLRELGVFLPYSPLHHLLLQGFDGPLVATSANLSGEPVLTDPTEARVRLASIADAYLHHDRPIVRPADDAVVRRVGTRMRVIRAGRGGAPIERPCAVRFKRPTLAVGGHMKAAIALGWDERIVLSPHIGDLDSLRSRTVFEQLIGDLQRLYCVAVEQVVCDQHRGYASARWAAASGLPVVRVQHHVAHASALAGEQPQIGRWLTFAWDGMGLGPDGELWGGEALLGAAGSWRRVASWRRFEVVGADQLAREPWRCAAALLWDVGQPWQPKAAGGELARQAWMRRTRTQRTSSVGRLFDAAAALVLGVESCSFEGQAAMLLESAAAPGAPGVPLALKRDAEGVWRSDWADLLPTLCDAGRPVGERAAVFHESIARALLDQVRKVAETEAFEAVGLTGGVFQNRWLAERVMTLLAAEGVRAVLPAAIPANDGGLAFGQLIEAAYRDVPGPVAEGT